MLCIASVASNVSPFWQGLIGDYRNFDVISVSLIVGMLFAQCSYCSKHMTINNFHRHLYATTEAYMET